MKRVATVFLVGCLIGACTGQEGGQEPEEPSPPAIPSAAGWEAPSARTARADARRQAVLRAAHALRVELGADDGLAAAATAGKSATRRGVIETSVSTEGHLAGLWGWRPGGLAHRRASESLQQTFGRFVDQHRDMFLLDDAAGAGRQMELGLPVVRTVEPVPGKTMTMLTYAPRFRGIAILGQPVVALFTGDTLTSIVGTFSPPDAAPEALLEARLTGAEAWSVASSRLGLGKEYRTTGAADARLHIDMGGRLVYRTEVLAATSGERWTALVDASTGRLMSLDGGTMNAQGMVAANYRVLHPDSHTNPGFRVEAIRGGAGSWVKDGVVYPWRGYSFSSGSPVYAYYKTATGTATFSQLEPFYDFTATRAESERKFGVQHVSYWAQRASLVADSYGAAYLVGTPHERRGVIVIESALPEGQGLYNSGQCNDVSIPFTEPGRSLSCVRFGPHIAEATIFHEMGHHLDHKLRGGGFGLIDRPPPSHTGHPSNCDMGTVEEGAAVAETIGITNALLMFRKEMAAFGFTGLNAADCGALTGIGCFTNMGPSAPGWVHKAGQHTRMACPPATCNDTNTTGNAFLQAFWESSHDRNCFNSPCYDMLGSAGLEEAIRAFYYAIFTLPPAPTHVQLSANFLTYYFNFVGQNEWNDRWWLFNHHALVGPKSGYSACHM